MIPMASAPPAFGLENDVDALFEEMKTGLRRRAQARRAGGTVLRLVSDERMRGPRRDIVDLFEEFEGVEQASGYAPDLRSTLDRPDRDGVGSWYPEEERLETIRARSPLGRALRSDFTWPLWGVMLGVFFWRCAYCNGSTDVEQDHVVALSHGGHDLIANLLPACHVCNESKGAQSVEEWLRRRGVEFAEKVRARVERGRVNFRRETR